MPRAERLSSRLDTLLDAAFNSPSDPFALYWDVAAQLRRNQLAPAQKKIRKTLRRGAEIGAQSAVLVACVLHLTGFPAHRILHFLSLYVPGGIRLSLFELAVSAIFLDVPPLPASVLYDLTQYTYLEKRLLVRKSIEITGALKGSLSPGVLLYLYLLSLREDLSNENIQLIALVMKNCFPAQDVRTRIAGTSLEEYGELARAWKSAEQRSRELDLRAGSGTERRGRSFDRDSASFFLDKYFSDEALAEMRAAAPAPVARRAPPKRSSAGREAARRIETAPHDTTVRADTRERLQTTVRGTRRSTDAEPAAPATARGEHGAAAAGAVSPSAGHRSSRRGRAAAAAPESVRGARAAAGASEHVSPHREHAAGASARASPRSEHAPGPADARHAGPQRAARAAEPSRAAPVRAAGPGGLRLIHLLPFFAATVLTTVFVVVLPSPGRNPGPAVRQSTTPSPVTALQQPPAPPLPAALPQPVTRTYVVRPGDSLWKIFTSMRPQNADRRGWMDFLSRTQTMNSLGDPDQLRPGKVLTLSRPEVTPPAARGLPQ